MQNVIKKIMEFQSKMEQLSNEVNTFSKSHQTLEKENNNPQREVKELTIQNLIEENNLLRDYLKAILEAIKHIFKNYYKLVMKLRKKPLQLK